MKYENRETHKAKDKDTETHKAQDEANNKSVVGFPFALKWPTTEGAKRTKREAYIVFIDVHQAATLPLVHTQPSRRLSK